MGRACSRRGRRSYEGIQSRSAGNDQRVTALRVRLHQHWHWTDVRGLTADNPGVDRYSQPGRHAAVNLVWEI